MNYSNCLFSVKHFHIPLLVGQVYGGCGVERGEIFVKYRNALEIRKDCLLILLSPRDHPLYILDKGEE